MDNSQYNQSVAWAESGGQLLAGGPNGQNIISVVGAGSTHILGSSAQGNTLEIDSANASGVTATINSDNVELIDGVSVFAVCQ